MFTLFMIATYTNCTKIILISLQKKSLEISFINASIGRVFKTGIVYRLSRKNLKSLKTLDRHNQTHNDIKPQNFLVKFKYGRNDLTQIKIALTDFGLAGPESQGGTPVFASPECFEKKEKKSDIFSFGRLILFLLVSKEQFLKWLFVPIPNLNVPTPTDMIALVTQMTSMTNRIDLNSARITFNELKRNSLVKPTQNIINSFDLIVNLNLNDITGYITELGDFR